MNKRQFLKTGFLGAIIGLFIPKVLAKSELSESLKRVGETSKNAGLSLDNLTNKIDKNQKFELTTGITISGLPKDSIAYKNWREHLENNGLFHFNIEGSMEQILKRQNMLLLYTFARAISEHDNNKHLNLDSIELFKQFRQKYKITNINT